MARATTGYLVLADISGYTRYLSSSEIERGPAIAADLLEVVVGGLRPVVKLAKLEGDAAFFAGPGTGMHPSELLDALEGTYAAFRRRIRSLRDSTSCTCAACSLVGDLDLKFFVHHGTWVRHRIAGHDELAGTDVIVAHRLLKGAAGSHVSLRGAALLTDAAVGALGIDPQQLGLRPFSETYDELGEVTGQIIDLGERWETARVARRAGGAHEPLVDETIELAIPPAEVWAWLSEPERRGAWDGEAPVEMETVGGRRGIGTTSQCVVGRLSTIEEVVEWRPYERLARRARVGRLGPMTWTWELHPEPGGTRVRMRWTRPRPAGHPRPIPPELLDEQRAALNRLAAVAGGVATP
ncbi:MAG TPA: DUF2652 domain-containing protein [Candidatus Limnocylindria bacterium]|nr:DUF2652 domain-containing protein [Candidatus Limnocylindria bacterium]